MTSNVDELLTRLAAHYEKDHPDPDMEICAFLDETIEEVRNIINQEVNKVLGEVMGEAELLQYLGSDPRTGQVEAVPLQAIKKRMG